MASGAAPCSEQRSSTGKTEKTAVGRGRRGAVMNPLGTGHCEVAGMQPEAVRIPKKSSEVEEELAKMEKEICKESREFSGGIISLDNAGCCPLCHQQPKDGQSQNEDKKEFNESPNKKQNKIENYIETQKHQVDINEEKCQFLIKKLIDAEMTINEVVDFSENEAPKREMRLESIFEYPQILDRYRTQVNYCVRLRRVTEEEMEFCKYRTLTKVVDYINYLSLINQNDVMEKSISLNNFGEALSVQDKIVLLRYGFAPLVLFDIAAGTISVTKDTQNLLCLPTGITLCAGETIVPNSFITQQIVSKCISSLVRLLADLKMDQEEFILMKLIIVLGMDSASGEDNEGTTTTFRSENFNYLLSPKSAINQNDCNNPPQLLSINGRHFVEKLRDSAHSALYSHSPQKSASTSSSEAALRFAKLLHILPKLTLISRDLIENIRMVHTFPSTRSRPTDPLFFDLFGDIFQPNKKQNINSSSFSSDFDEQFIQNSQRQINYFNNNFGEGNGQKQNNNFELSDYEQQQFKNDLISRTKRDVNMWWQNEEF
uniref:NR LBD domain-containing protein n=1 Tax=Meloidogyne hapla TaxID=6305 RepID=A0A1I8BUW0_MELHA